jgi:hypothetical protein
MSELMVVPAEAVLNEPAAKRERVKLIDGDRLRSVFQAGGTLSLQNIIAWVRRLVELLLSPFKLLGGLRTSAPAAPGVAPVDDAVVGVRAAKGSAVPPAKEGTQPIDVATFGKNAKDGGASTADGEKKTAANDPKAAEAAGDAKDKSAADAPSDPGVSGDTAQIVEELVKTGADLELELLGLPEEINAVRQQILAMLEPIISAGYKLDKPTDPGAQDRLLQSMGEEAQRMHYIQKLGARQIVHLAKMIQDNQPETLGMSVEAVINYTRQLGAGARYDGTKQSPLYAKLRSLLEADGKLRSGYSRHIAGAAATIKTLAAKQDDVKKRLQDAFLGGNQNSYYDLVMKEHELLKDPASLDGGGSDKGKRVNVHESEVLFYTVETPEKALEAAFTSEERPGVPPEAASGRSDKVEATPSQVSPAQAPTAQPPAQSSAVKVSKDAGKDSRAVEPGAKPSQSVETPQAAAVDRSKMSLSQRAMLDAAEENDGFDETEGVRFVS